MGLFEFEKIERWWESGKPIHNSEDVAIVLIIKINKKDEIHQKVYQNII
jgi:hypothetical protein